MLNPTNDAQPSTPPTGCGCGSPTSSAPSPLEDDTAGDMLPYDGASTYEYTGPDVPGRGLDWSLDLTYRSDVTSDGPVGSGWEMNYDRRLQVVDAANLAMFQAADPTAKIGDVDLIDGQGRDALYVLNPGGSYTSPAGFYTTLAQDADGSYTERFSDGSFIDYRPADSGSMATMESMSDASGDTMTFTYNYLDQLTFVTDTMGRSYQYSYNSSGLLTAVTDYDGRTTRFTYNASDDLVAVTTPAVTGTPTGNDYPSGRTTQFTYNSSGQLLTVTAPDEVMTGGAPYLTYTYDGQGRVHTLTEGGTNAFGVPAGGTITYSYQTLGSPSGPTDTATATRQTTVTDRNGNITVYEYNQYNNTLSMTQELNRGVDPGLPTSTAYTTVYTYDRDYHLTKMVTPNGTTTTYNYDTGMHNGMPVPRTSQGNLLSQTVTPDAARGGDQSFITTTYTYEPIYNKILTTTEPRGNDPSYVPQNGGATSAARYTTTYTYDYQEGSNFAAISAKVGLSAAAVQALLTAYDVPTGLGDVNGDGLTNQVNGNLIREQDPSVALLTGSNEAAIQGSTSQPIVTLYTYNSFGQMTSTTDPEGNVTLYTYYPERSPSGNGVIYDPGGDPTTGGYLMQTIEDAVSAPGRDSGTNPTPAAITTTYIYDAVGNQTQVTDGRGIVTQYVYNQLDELVETISAAAVPGVSAQEPLPLAAYNYIERYFYDANGNMVLDQVEDRGDTSNLGYTPPAGSLPSYITNTDPPGGTTYDDTVTRYDILNDPIDSIQEVGGGQWLDTRMRYDPDGNLVLTIQPEGNSTSAIYDERNMLFRSFRGMGPPPLVLLGPGDLTNYNDRGGAPCYCESYRYDGDGNLIESVDADDNDLSTSNNDPTLGPGDRTLYTYDGFDRRTSVIDAVGNQTVMQYDPDGNVVRTLDFGPVGGPSPTSNGPLIPAEPVSSLGVIQPGNLVNSNLLAATETSYDELGREIQTSRVLFVNTIPTTRKPNVAEGGSDVGLGSLTTPGQTLVIPGVAGITILGRVSDRTEYDRDSRTTFTIEDDLSTTRTFYDGAGRVIETEDSALNNGYSGGAFNPANLSGNTVQTAYDADNNVIETRQTDVTVLPGVAPEVFLTTNFYDSLNRLQETVDNLAETNYFRYDSRGNLVATADAQGPLNGQTITRRAFSDGPRTVDAINGYGNVTLYFYDGLDRKTLEEQILTALPTTPGGTASGDGVHIGASIYGVKDDPSAPESFPPTPDTKQGGGDGIIKTAWVYDGDSNLSAMIDDDGNVSVCLYDDLNRKIAEIDGMTVNSTYTAANVLGDRVIPTPTAATINDPAMIPTSDINAELAEVQSRISAIASQFPPLASQVNDAPPQTTIWGYSPNNDVLIMQDPNGTETFTKYDAINRIIAERVFRAGQHDSFAGDPIFAPAPVNPIPTNGSTAVVNGTTVQNFQYDGLSRMTYAFDNNDPTTAAADSTVTDAYDSLSRIIEEAQTIGGQPTQVISSAWRADDLRSALTYPNGRVETYTYDNLDRIATISDQGASQPIAIYDYIGVDRVLERMYPQNGTEETYLDNTGTVDIGYDGLARPIEDRTLRTDNSLVIGFTYTYDRMGVKLTQGKLHDPNNSETYSYDSAYRLVGFNRAAGGITPSQTSWTLDGVGNPVAVNGNAQQFSSTNELTVQNSSGTPTAVTYNNDGNQTNDGTYSYTYDAGNRLTSVTRDSDGKLIAVYSYDALGRLIQKVVTNDGSLNGTTEYAYDGEQDIAEQNGTGILTQQYVYGVGINEPLVLDRNLTGGSTATAPGDQRLFYNQDALGSVYALTDTNGVVVEGYQYDAYGKQTVFDPGPGNAPVFSAGQTVNIGGFSQVGNPYLFTGQRLDPETGLYYDRARYYNPIQNRFLSVDPMDLEQPGTNTYEYADGQPTDMTDPSGMQTAQDKVNAISDGINYILRTGNSGGLSRAVALMNIKAGLADNDPVVRNETMRLLKAAYAQARLAACIMRNPVGSPFIQGLLNRLFNLSTKAEAGDMLLEEVGKAAGLPPMATGAIPDKSQQRIIDLVRQMGDDDFLVRERATAELAQRMAQCPAEWCFLATNPTIVRLRQDDVEIDRRLTDPDNRIQLPPMG
jgi:RHS repeat-associated protein